MLVGGITFFGVASPYILLVRKHTGGWFIVPRMVSTLYLPDVNTHYKEAAKNQLPADLQLDREPPPTLKFFNSKFLFLKAVKNLHLIYSHFLVMLLPPLLLVLAGLGLFRRTWDQKRLSQELFVASFILFNFFFYSITWVRLVRYLFPALPFLLLWAANGLSELWEWSHEKPQERDAREVRAVTTFIFVLCVALVMLYYEYTIYFTILGKATGQPVEYKRAGLWIREHSTSRPLVMFRRGVGWYAGAKRTNVPGSYSEMIQAAKKYRVDYIVVDEFFERDRPALSFLLDPTKAPPELKPVYAETGTPGHRIVVYQIVSRSSDSR